MSSTTASATIDVLRELFAIHGIPDVVVSDNGPPFDSREYQSFLKSNGIRPILVAPRRAAGNGQAERVVQSAKDSLRRIVRGSWKKRLAQYLLFQHITPSSVTNLSPSEVLMGRRLRSCLDLCHPDLVRDLREKQETEFLKQTGTVRKFSPDDTVLVKNYSRGPAWVPAKVTDVTGPVSYRAITDSGQVVRRHVDQMLKNQVVPSSPSLPSTSDVEPSTALDSNLPEPINKSTYLLTPGQQRLQQILRRSPHRQGLHRDLHRPISCRDPSEVEDLLSAMVPSWCEGVL